MRERFLDLARREPHRYLVIDASEDRADIQAAIRSRLRDTLPVSARKRAELAARLAEEEDQRRRKATAEADVLRLDRELRGRQRDESIARAEKQRQVREEVERQLTEEAGGPGETVPAASPAPSGWAPLGAQSGEGPPAAPARATPPPTAFRVPSGSSPAAPTVPTATPAATPAATPVAAPAVPARTADPAAPTVPVEPPSSAAPRLSGAPSLPNAPSDAATAVLHAMPTVEITAHDLALARGDAMPTVEQTHEQAPPSRASRRQQPGPPAAPTAAGRFMRRLRGAADGPALPPDGGSAEARTLPPTAAIDLRDELFGAGEDDR